MAFFFGFCGCNVQGICREKRRSSTQSKHLDMNKEYVKFTKAKKRVLLIIKDMTLGGGAQKQIVELANGLYERGLEVAVLVFDRKTENSRTKDLHKGIELLYTRRNYPRVPLLEGVYETIKVILRWKPDVLYSRLWTTKPVATIAGKLLGIRVVLGVANSEVHQTERKKHKTLTRFYRRNIYRLADIVIAVSEGLRQEVRKTYHLTHVKTIHNGIDVKSIEAITNDKFPHEYFRDDIPVLVSVGRLAPQKGYKYLLEAFSIVNETIEARLLIVGDGELKEELIRTTKKLGIQDKVVMVGEKESRAYISHADVFVISSLHEGMPNVILESMVLGTPIVATDCDHGPRELIENEKNGLLVPIANPVKLASAICKLIKDRSFASELAANAKERSRCFTRDKMISNYERIFLNA